MKKVIAILALGALAANLAYADDNAQAPQSGTNMNAPSQPADPATTKNATQQNGTSTTDSNNTTDTTMPADGSSNSGSTDSSTTNSDQ
ncbi:MAG: hypothetical protein A3F18_03175 [Legionellales bacterium RIFCSPHIGHO2_12_FULL_37_14]|nr:MAG: hypothetical protein A3F18_03175 [Legionellales bacterium RIFCSPHIGHO2_12_FULL_37_14]